MIGDSRVLLDVLKVDGGVTANSLCMRLQAAVLRANWHGSRRWTPQWSEEQRFNGYAGLRKAIERTLNWVEVD
jgi:glycerol kinase